MDILWLLIPLSAVLVLGIIGVFGWALNRGQFDDLEREGTRILATDPEPVDGDQSPAGSSAEQYPGPGSGHSRV
ncbi:cbb3-type cytochrome oxidase assembly protein CcoS [Pseudaquabacterium rugosum]|jgi:cbb3-type cytochrome oxidase maturation protein|uniref:Cbb3-type cytochrome oxidase assembly protein CcoS n=1 Tax=Pseudaquabacterium rugosum TaxID=2984194 RepID=A0ABU9BDD2_9BURK